MNSNVHIPVGIALSLTASMALPVMQPDTMPEMLLGLSLATIGSVIPDIDINKKGEGMLKCAKTTLSMICTLTLGAVYELNYINIPCFAIVVVSLIIGLFSSHRRFTHWLVGLFTFNVGVIGVVGFKIGLWFFFGMLSHQLLDMLNKKEVQWLYPLKLDFSRYLVSSDSKISKLIGVFAYVSSFALISYYM